MFLTVAPISGTEVDRWIETKHYSRRVPPIQYAFAAYMDDNLQGIVTYAPPSSPQVAISVCNSDYRQNVIELNRLVVDSRDKNAASKLVSKSLQLLPKPSLVVSYADSGVGHVGYIYQATNWFYCGTATAHDSEYLVNGKRIHPRSLAAEGISNPVEWAKQNGIERISAKPKHRYLYLVGSKTDKKKMMQSLNWCIDVNYPKGDTQRHPFSEDASKNIQLGFF